LQLPEIATHCCVCIDANCFDSDEWLICTKCEESIHKRCAPENFSFEGRICDGCRNESSLCAGCGKTDGFKIIYRHSNSKTYHWHPICYHLQQAVITREEYGKLFPGFDESFFQCIVCKEPNAQLKKNDFLLSCSAAICFEECFHPYCLYTHAKTATGVVPIEPALCLKPHPNDRSKSFCSVYCSLHIDMLARDFNAGNGDKCIPCIDLLKRQKNHRDSHNGGPVLIPGGYLFLFIALYTIFLVLNYF